MRRNIFIFLFLLIVLCACNEGPNSKTSTTSPSCRLNSDCPIGERCEIETCVPDQVLDSEVQCEDECPCQSNGDCAVGEGCDIERGECVVLDCLKTADCELGQVCLDHQCLTDLDADRDRDSVADHVDNCPNIENPDQGNFDRDELGDVCDVDDFIDMLCSS